VHVGLAGPGTRTVRTLWLEGDRLAVRRASVRAALSLLREHLA
jgi:nicotinamide-nucleotide amidase